METASACQSLEPGQADGGGKQSYEGKTCEAAMTAFNAEVDAAATDKNPPTVPAPTPVVATDGSALQSNIHIAIAILVIVWWIGICFFDHGSTMCRPQAVEVAPVPQKRRESTILYAREPSEVGKSPGSEHRKPKVVVA